MRRLLSIILLATTLWVGGAIEPREAVCLNTLESVHARLDVAGLPELKSAWESAWTARGEMITTLERLITRYEEKVARIESLKKKGVDNISRGKLERELREAKELASQLESLQRKILERDQQMERIGNQIVELLDGERLVLEQELVRGGSVAKHGELIATLNELSQERERYAKPLPSLDQKSYAAVLEDARDVEDPDDMLAMADELLDAEGQIQKQVAELESRLDSLKTRQKLLRRSSNFWREERFFEEGDRGRTFGSRSRIVSSNTDSQEERGSNANGDGVDRDGVQSGAPDRAPPEVSEPTTDESDVDVAQGAPAAGDDSRFENDGLESGSDSDPNEFGGSYASDPGLTDNPGTVGLPSNSGNGGGATGDPFAPPSDVVIIERQADPNVSTGSASDVPDSQLTGRIRALEKEKQSLEQRAKDLRSRAKRLQQKAKDAE